MDLISVIVPIYNVDAYLHQCVDSIVRQSYDNLDIVLVNDGSTDSATEICEYFRKRDSRIHVISKPNGGLVSARKAGLAAARGDYVFYVDGDDWLDLDCLAQYHRAATESAADIVIGGHKREFLGNFVEARNRLDPGVYAGARLHTDLFPHMISTGDFFTHGIRTYSWGKLYRRGLVEDLQQRVPDGVVLAEDSALLYPALLAAHSVHVTSISAYNYRQRPNSILKSTSIDEHETSRLAQAFSFLATALAAGHEDCDFPRQLRAYFAAMLIIRNGAFTHDHATYCRYKLFGDIEYGARICLYNSGSFGQHVYTNLQRGKAFSLVAWFDRDFRESRLINMPVEDPAQISRFDFDYLLVPSYDPSVLAEATSLFVANGLPVEKIRKIAIDTSSLPDFISMTGFDPESFESRKPQP